MLEILDLRAYDGPNILMPQAGVSALIHADKDRGRRLRDALKAAAQSVGLVVGFLACEAQPAEEGFLLRCHFSSPYPSLARDLVAYVVEGINRELAQDEEWDADEPLFELQRRRRREAPPLALLQLVAEAQQRGLPVLRRPDGRTQLGYGARAWGFEAGQFDLGLPVEPPWQQIGAVPLIAATGGGAAACLAQVAAGLPTSLGQPLLVTSAGFDAALAALSNPDADLLLLGLEAKAILERGLPFDRCSLSAIVDMPAPPAGFSQQDHLRALGVPLLLTSPRGRAALNADEPRLLELAAYAPCPLILCSAQDEGAAVERHRAAGGEALLVAGEQIIFARGAQVEARLPLSAAGPNLVAGLAALALSWALGAT